MQYPTIKLDTLFYEVLVTRGLNHFTVMQLRDAIGAHDANVDPDKGPDLHKKAYKQVLRLIKLGLLEKHKKGREFATYVQTELFAKVRFLKAPTRRRRAPVVIEAPDMGSNATPPMRIADTLQETVRQYQVDLLSCVGESEEYMRLYNQFPDLKAHIEPQYLSARERSSKLLGQIKAVETVLKRLAPSPAA